MAGKKQKGGIVYSTNPDYIYNPGGETPQHTPSSQDLRVWLEQRGGKMTTIVRGFQGSADAVEQLARRLKSYCSTGGSAKDGMILIQGDQRDKVIAMLLKEGHRAKKAGR
jgi:translation initiation factor 1